MIERRSDGLSYGIDSLVAIDREPRALVAVRSLDLELHQDLDNVPEK